MCVKCEANILRLLNWTQAISISILFSSNCYNLQWSKNTQDGSVTLRMITNDFVLALSGITERH